MLMASNFFVMKEEGHPCPVVHLKGKWNVCSSYDLLLLLKAVF